jgi:hypothetical protein
VFELQRLSGNRARSIPLATRAGTEIPNEVAADPSPQHFARYEALLQKHKFGWRPRKPPCGGYNCFGHVWASRRTAIYDTESVRRILVEDGYRITLNPQVDDVALVVEESDVYHVGRVIELRSVNPGSPSIPWILSKWDDWGGEVLHSVQDLPFDPSQGFNTQVEFWTDRPKSIE